VSNRREFTKRQRAQIVERAMNERGQICCEGCGFVLGSKAYEVDHTIPEALIRDKTKPLTIEDGKLLGVACCHRGPDGKTAVDVAVIAKAVRISHKRLGIKKPSGFRKPPPGYNSWTRRIER
jgi:hypothetical protein